MSATSIISYISKCLISSPFYTARGLFYISRYIYYTGSNTHIDQEYLVIDSNDIELDSGKNIYKKKGKEEKRIEYEKYEKNGENENIILKIPHPDASSVGRNSLEDISSTKIYYITTEHFTPPLINKTYFSSIGDSFFFIIGTMLEYPVLTVFIFSHIVPYSYWYKLYKMFPQLLQYVPVMTLK